MPDKVVAMWEASLVRVTGRKKYISKLLRYLLSIDVQITNLVFRFSILKSPGNNKCHSSEKFVFYILHEHMQSLNFLACVRGEILNSYSETENINNVPEITELLQYSRTSFKNIYCLL